MPSHGSGRRPAHYRGGSLWILQSRARRGRDGTRARHLGNCTAKHLAGRSLEQNKNRVKNKGQDRGSRESHLSGPAHYSHTPSGSPLVPKRASNTFTRVFCKAPTCSLETSKPTGTSPQSRRQGGRFAGCPYAFI